MPEKTIEHAVETQRLPEKKPTSRIQQLKRGLMHGAFALGLLTASPQSSYAQNEVQSQAAVDEQSPEYFAEKIKKDLEPGKTLEVVDGVLFISPQAKRHENFSKDVLSSDLGEVAFLDPKTPLKLNQPEKVHHAIIEKSGGREYIVYQTSRQNGSKVVAVALDPSNWNNITSFTKEGSEIFSEQSPDVIKTTNVQSIGSAPTNGDRTGFFARNKEGQLVEIMKIETNLSQKPLN